MHATFQHIPCCTNTISSNLNKWPTHINYPKSIFKSRVDGIWLITRCHIKLRSHAGRGPRASRLTTRTLFNHKYGGELFPTEGKIKHVNTCTNDTVKRSSLVPSDILTRAMKYNLRVFMAHCQIPQKSAQTF